MSAIAAPVCLTCLDSGHVCENHPNRPWWGIVGDGDPRACDCGAGMPCPQCCDEIPADGLVSIVAAFTPRHLVRNPYLRQVGWDC